MTSFPDRPGQDPVAPPPATPATELADSAPPPAAPATELADSAQEVVDRLRDGMEDDKEKKKAHRSFWRELPVLILVALVVAVVIKTFFVQAFYIPSGSMEDTLLIGDRVMVNKLAYRFGEPSRGDVVVFDSPFSAERRSESLPAAVLRNVGEALGLSSPASEFIKRIVAVPGDTLEIRDNEVIVNGAVLDEPYRHPTTRMRDLSERVIPEGMVWVMGDNRNNSSDSRTFEEIPVDEIVGRAFFKVWPPSSWGGL